MASLWTMTPKGPRPNADGKSAPSATFVRLFGRSGRYLDSTVPSWKRTVTKTSAMRDDGFASSTYVSRPPGPTSAPANAQRACGAVAPGELCASYQKSAVTAGPGHHMVRSTTTGTWFVDRTRADSAAMASGFCPEPTGSSSSSTQMVWRLFAATVYVLDRAPPPSIR